MKHPQLDYPGDLSVEDQESDHLFAVELAVKH